MIFQTTRIAGVFVIDIEPHGDERGFFARTWCREEFLSHGLNPDLAQCSVSFNHRPGTLRGMHYQKAPHGEDKLVRCTRGAIFDVALDLREDSPTSGQWIAAELSADNLCMLYIPKGCAHGFQSLEDNSEVFYQISQPYVLGHGTGYRFDDPAFEINWPLPVNCISNQDLDWPSFSRVAAVRNG
ncbi:MAG: dTDP-4-dehydrorhamnose 3,5-epimerase [Gemmatimonadaceae bacterium]|nr:dTDP-4-dehydrorhamnose 3,5-epimerase [Gloeobacterales cyanobacterium ES-bin-141]